MLARRVFSAAPRPARAFSTSSGSLAKKYDADIEPPRRALSAYQLWQAERFAEKKASLKEGEKIPFEDFTGQLGKEWKSFSDAEKEPWQKKYEAARQQWEKEWKRWWDARSPAELKEINARRKEEGKSSLKAPQDTAAYGPKRPLTSFLRFSAEVRPEYQGLSLTETAKKIGERWKALSEGEKETYKKAWEVEKAEYDAKKQ